MSFFDKQQEVLDVKLTQFGKNLLSRGAFKPVYYQFFDDGVLYNSSCANIPETQNRSQERIFEVPRLKTMHTVVSVDGIYDHFENQINSGERNRFPEIKRRQNPLVADKMLKYPLKNSHVNLQASPRFKLVSLEQKPSSIQQEFLNEIHDFNIPQINFTCSYKLTRDDTEAMSPERLLQYTMGSDRYFDLTSEKINFLDNSFLEIIKKDIVIDLEEFNSFEVFDNFEIEIYEILDQPDGTNKETLVRLETEEEVKRLFEISTDHEISAERLVDKKQEYVK